jgi:hypothetical protein
VGRTEMLAGRSGLRRFDFNVDKAAALREDTGSVGSSEAVDDAMAVSIASVEHDIVG